MVTVHNLINIFISQLLFTSRNSHTMLGYTIHVWFFVRFYDNVLSIYLGAMQVLLMQMGCGVSNVQKKVLRNT